LLFRARTRRHAARLIVCVAGATLATAPAASAADVSATASARSGAPVAGISRQCGGMRRAVRCAINQQRARYGLRPLAANRRLARAATRHARDMARHNYFSHVSRNGKSPLRRVRAAGWRRGVGEALAWGCGPDASPTAIVAAWLGSSAHRAIILGSGRVVGIGYKRGAGCSGGRAFVVAEVG
jgi:uncharacterized protein YkwD